MKKSLTTLALTSALLFSTHGYSQEVPSGASKKTCDEKCKKTVGQESSCPHCKKKGCKACCKEDCSEESCKHDDSSKSHEGHSSQQ